MGAQRQVCSWRLRSSTGRCEEEGFRAVLRLWEYEQYFGGIGKADVQLEAKRQCLGM